MASRISLVTLFGGLLASSLALAQPTVYVDTEFDVEADWKLFGPFVVPEDAQGADFGAQQIAGVNPYMEVALTRAAVNSGSVETWGMLINETMRWDPDETADGPLGKIDLSFHIVGGGAWSLAVEQDGFVWYALAKRFVRTSNDPTVITIKGLVEEDFIPVRGSEFEPEFKDQAMHPDFSADGGLITFGIGIGFSCPQTSNCSAPLARSMDIDDLEITAYPDVPLNGGHNGNWWHGADRSGEGVQVEIADAGDGLLVLVATIYSYDAEGNQIFMIAVGIVDGDTAEVEVYITEGGVWGEAFDPQLVVESLWGTGTFTACGCDNMVMDLRPNAEYQARGFTNLLGYELIRLTSTVIPCPYEAQL